MVNRNLREAIPKNIILMIDSCTIPSDYSLFSTYNNKYLKTTSSAASDPGSPIGSSTHTHTSDSHTHSTSGSTSHTHTLSAGATPQVFGNRASGSDVLIAKNCHSHPSPASIPAISPPATLGTSPSHTHGAKNNTPSFYTYKFIKKSSISMRQNQIPFNTLAIWGKPLSCIPDNFTLDSANLAKLTRGVTNDCTTPGGSGGSTNHTHSSTGHTHPVSIGSHTHPTAFTASSSGNQGADNTPSTSAFIACSHTHSSGGNTGAVSDSANTNSDSHTHDSQGIIPSYQEIAYIKKTSIHMNEKGITKNLISMWACPVACIPNNNQIADGTNCTLSMLNKYIRSIATACTNPGGTGGCNTHTHSNVISTHSDVNASHSHPLPSTTGASTGPFFGRPGPFSTNQPAAPHTHPITGSSSSSPITITVSAESGGHTHGSIDHKPDTIEVGFIQRL